MAGWGMLGCRVGLHTGSWARIAVIGDCRWQRTCARCGRVSTKVDHSWSDYRFVSVSRCDQLRTCARCSGREERVLHSWGRSSYDEAGRCATTRRCLRCGVTQRGGDEHHFSAWDYVDPDSCRQTVVCRRCGREGHEKRLWHDWGPFQHAGGSTSVRCCRRCGLLSGPPASPAPDEVDEWRKAGPALRGGGFR